VAEDHNNHAKVKDFPENDEFEEEDEPLITFPNEKDPFSPPRGNQESRTLPLSVQKKAI
jgi:hypothetical protein